MLLCGIAELPGERPRRECKDVALLWPVRFNIPFTVPYLLILLSGMRCSPNSLQAT
jgi:hypothetical protein